MTKRTSLALCIAYLGFSATGRSETYGGIEVPDGAIAFADSVAEYSPGSNATGNWRNPAAALGEPQLSGGGFPNDVSLGNGGSLTLQFVDNVLENG